MSQFLQQLLNGTVLGATFGLIALGYTMVYGIIQLINFAHGEVVMVGAFAGLSAYRYLLPDSLVDNTAVALPVILLCAAAAALVTAVLLERLAYRPLRNAPRLAPLITAIGMSLFLQEAVRLFYPGGKSQLPFPRLVSSRTLNLGDVTVPWVSIFTLVLAFSLMVALDLFINRTRVGQAMRATAQDPDTARLMGVNTDLVIVITFAIGGALAGLAGVAQGMRFVAIDFRIGFTAGLKAFTAAVLGGIGNIRGAMLGGLMIGIVDALATQYFPGHGAWKDVWIFVVLILVLTVRPQGLLGERVATRA